jgi:nucleotide-binding universal stress UspA family protein
MYKDILFPVDITQDSSWGTALPVVLEYVEAFNAKLHVLYVVSDYGMSIVQQYFPKGAVEEVITKAKADLHSFVETHVPAGIKVQHIIGRGSVYDCIIDTAEKVGADLIVMSANRPELKDYLLGPNAAKVVRHSEISVLVVREKNRKKIRKK